jgi:cobalamin biosynthesis protein CobC
LASWRSGYAEDCKSFYPGSIPGEASNSQTIRRRDRDKMTIPPDASIPRHGGDLDYAERLYGKPQDGWLDLSTGINPAAYPSQPIDPAGLAALPGRDALEALINSARTAYGVPADTRLIAVPGTEIALRLLPHVAMSGSVAILGPTYESHRDAWAASGRQVEEIVSTADIPDKAAIVVLANPNNPDGRIFTRAELNDLATRLSRKSGILIIDEAFADLDPDHSLIPDLDKVPALVLRSFGKFFGLAGLRLGFVAGEASLVDRLSQLLGDWPVSSAAITIGRAALGDRDWQQATRIELASKAATLRALLSRHGLSIVGGTDLFVLVQHCDALRIHKRLARAGIWTRSFAYNLEWLRIGLPPDEAAFARLDRALAAAISGSR